MTFSENLGSLVLSNTRARHPEDFKFSLFFRKSST